MINTFLSSLDNCIERDIDNISLKFWAHHIAKKNAWISRKKTEDREWSCWCSTNSAAARVSRAHSSCVHSWVTMCLHTLLSLWIAVLVLVNKVEMCVCVCAYVRAFGMDDLHVQMAFLELLYQQLKQKLCRLQSENVFSHLCWLAHTHSCTRAHTHAHAHHTISVMLNGRR